MAIKIDYLVQKVAEISEHIAISNVNNVTLKDVVQTQLTLASIQLDILQVMMNYSAESLSELEEIRKRVGLR